MERKGRTSQVLAQLYKKGVQIACNPILPCVSVRRPIISYPLGAKIEKILFPDAVFNKKTPYEMK